MKKNTPFFPEALRSFFWDVLQKFFGVIIFLLGVFLLDSLCNFSAEHSSWNTASNITISENLFSLIMNYVADIFLQIFGLSSIILSIILMTWGLLWFRRDFFFKSFRLTCFPFLLASFSIAFAGLPEHQASFSWGGVLGNWLFFIICSYLNFWVVCIFFWITSFFLFFFVLGLRKSDWKKFIYFICCNNKKIKFIFWKIFHQLFSKVPVEDFSNNDQDQSSINRKLIPIKTFAMEDKLIDSKLSQPFHSSISRINHTDYIPPDSKLLKPGEELDHHCNNDVISDAMEDKLIDSKLSQPFHSSISRINHTDYIPPDSKLLKPGEGLDRHYNNDIISAELLLKTLKDFNIKGLIHNMNVGPVVTLYEFEPAPGIKVSRIINLANDIARGIGALSVRIGVIPGKKVLGIELSNKNRSFVRFHDVLISVSKKITTYKLPLILGVDIAGVPEVVDLASMPHLLMAGTTGSGKSVGLNTMILSLIFFLSPQQCRFIMIDPKMLELSVYHDIPHLLTPVVTDSKKAAAALQWAVRQMEDRYMRMSEYAVRNIESFNKKAEIDGESPLPYIVIIIDEMADLMMVAGKEIETHVQRLAQMARAAGIHLITATQRPSVDVITGTIKSNFAHRISFKVTSKIDSRTILGEMGAEQLLGKGDMLYLSGGGEMKRIHGPFVEDVEVESICNDLRNRYAVQYESSVTHSLEYSLEDSDESDQLLEEAIALVIAEGKASTSFVQRYFKIGYNRAARLMESMERQGVVSRADSAGRRQVLIESKG